MNTFCPACARMVSAREENLPGKQVFRCGTCNLVLKEVVAGAGAASRPGPPVAARPPTSPPFQPGPRAPTPGPRAPTPAPRTTTGPQRAAAPAPKPPPTPSMEAIELFDEGTSEFVLEAGGMERAMTVRSSGHVEAAPAQPGHVGAPAPPPPPGETEAPDPGLAFDSGTEIFDLDSKPVPPPIGGAPPPPAPARPSAPMNSAAAAFARSTSGADVLFERVVIADATGLGALVRKGLLQMGMSKDVQVCINGEEFLRVTVEMLARKAPVNLAILDVAMPLLTGNQAAIALRAVERALKLTTLTPVLFYTAQPLDGPLRGSLDLCQPARYLKREESDPSRLAAHLMQVLRTARR